MNSVNEGAFVSEKVQTLWCDDILPCEHLPYNYVAVGFHKLYLRAEQTSALIKLSSKICQDYEHTLKQFFFTLCQTRLYELIGHM